MCVCVCVCVCVYVRTFPCLVSIFGGIHRVSAKVKVVKVQPPDGGPDLQGDGAYVCVCVCVCEKIEGEKGYLLIYRCVCV